MSRETQLLIAVGSCLAAAAMLVTAGGQLVLAAGLGLLLLGIGGYFRPLWFAYVYLLAAPLDGFSVVHQPLELSAADLAAVAMLGAVLMRPRRLLTPPKWLLVSLAALVLIAAQAALRAGTPESMITLRVFAGKVVGGYLAAVLLLEHGAVSGGVLVFCLGILASVAVGVVQQVAYLLGGWQELSKWLPAGAIAAQARGFTLLPLRSPGGTSHPVFLGVMAGYPAGLGLGEMLMKGERRRYLLLTAVAGVLGLLVTESRAVLLGLLSALGIGLLHRALRDRSTLNLFFMCVLLAVLALIANVLVGPEVGTRIEVAAEMMDRADLLLMGVGPGEYERINRTGLNVHSTPLQILTDLGSLGMVAFLFLLAGLLRSLWRGASSPQVLMVMCATVAFLVPCVFLHPLANTRELWIVITLSATITHSSHNSVNADDETHTPLPAVLVASSKR